ncbi:hypothetical protein FT663_02421 [Candidozyma haemuli var. vulneris]|uniref:Enoyl reductase (ER) domain-containing protein n=1 Tax=Candidozyma haemuli TaxID=45357 RepID=A0A2V1ANB5_9ASCO|nr:hypothetical protein CXQ85_001495 [[Candida] haemuloni]KAF3992104.1 hypothetical protein FT663_02421 [[Candida] haemuloni var. vulneris]KAF3992722.1 hypothetical protein FT662_00931 [[Candida] haemuloni var. vulneris]PVH19194.1 hypothetical protein CXQ85_001495 [[Candida] haemuloni]
MTLKFRAVQYSGSCDPLLIKEDQLDVSKGPDGSFQVDPTKVLVKIKCAALNPVDLVTKNTTPLPLAYKTKGIGYDYSGVVVGIGKEAEKKTGVKIGSKVCGMFQEVLGRGTLAEYALMDTATSSGASIHEFPEGLTFQEAASYPLVLGTAVLMFSKIQKANKKRRILILGSGTTVGKLCVQIAKNVHGFEDVVTTCSPKSVDLVKSLGGNTWIDYTAWDSILDPVLELVGMKGKFDVIFDCAGNSDLFPQIQNILVGKKEGGTYVTISGDYKYSFSSPTVLQLIWNNIGLPKRLAESKVGYLDYTYAFVGVIKSMYPWQKECQQYLGEKKVKLTIDSVYPFVEFDQAYKRLGSNRANGKVVVNVEDDV